MVAVSSCSGNYIILAVMPKLATVNKLTPLTIQ